MLSQGGQQYNAMIGDDENSGFMGFGLLGLWVFDIYIYIYIFFFFIGVFGSSSHGNFFFSDLKISQ